MINRKEVEWKYHTGRDQHGDRFSMWCGIHISGRILVKILGPTTPDEFVHRVCFYLFIPKSVLADQNECFDFVDADSAKQFAIEVLQKVSLDAPPAETTSTIQSSEPNRPKAEA